MKRLLPLLLLLLAPALRAQEAVSGSSRAFVVDTRCRDFVISDVKSAFCSGAYGPSRGKYATFLNGVTANVEFTVTMLGTDVPVEKVVVNGREFAGSKFTFDVGTIPVGGQLVVVAHGTVNGEDVASAPFVANLDVASQPGFYGFTGLELDFAGKKGYVAKGSVKFEIGSDAPFTSAHPWWLPAGVTQFSPLVGFKADYSVESGSFTFSPTAYSSAGTKKIRTRRRNGRFGKSIGVDYEMSVDGVLSFRWSPDTLGWMADSVGLQGEVSGETDWTYPFAVPTPVGPVPMFAEASLEAKAKGGLRYHFPGVADGMCRASSWEWTLESDKCPSLGGALGVGVNKLLDVKGGEIGRAACRDRV